MLRTISILVAIAGPAFAQFSRSPSFGTQRAPQPSFLVILLDDVGVDLLDAYGGRNAPCTPTIDSLAAEGMRFTRCWAYPLCSPARAALLTGKYAFRTGIGANVENTGGRAGLSPAELTLAERLGPVYSTALCGKWHLSEPNQPDGPRQVGGFDTAAGSLFNLSNSVDEGGYYDWIKTIDGVSFETTKYATIDTIDDTVAAMRTLPAPWFVFASINAPHKPFELPPDSDYCQSTDDVAGLIRATLEYADRELARVVAEAQSQNAYIILLGDNGSVSAAFNDDIVPDLPRGYKGTLYEGGVHVPLIVTGPRVRHGVTDALVSIVDIYATIGELALMTTPEATDSVSFANVLAGGKGRRRYLYAERFPDTFVAGTPFDPEWHERAVSNGRWKLIRRTGEPDHLYNITVEGLEGHDSYPPTTPLRINNYNRLVGELERLGVD